MPEETQEKEVGAEQRKTEAKSESAEKTPEYVAELKAELAALRAKLDESSESEDEVSDAQLQREYDEWIKSQQQTSEAGDADKTEGQIILERIGRLEQTLATDKSERLREAAMTKICAKYRKEVADWEEIEPIVLDLAKKGGKAFTDEQYMNFARAELKRSGKKTEAKTEKKTEETGKTGDEAQKATESAKRAATEKPTGGGASAEKQYTSLAEAARDALEEIKAQNPEWLPDH